MLHAAVLSGLGPARTPGLLLVGRLEVRIKESPRTVLADPEPSAETVADLPTPAAPSVEAVSEAPSDLPETSSPIELPLPPEVFFKSSELDQQPYPLVAVKPAYPPHARVLELEGWVRLLLLIDETGRVIQLEVLEASPEGIFDEEAQLAFRSAPFSPGRRGGEAVKSRMIVKVEFKSEDRQTERAEQGRPRQVP
ncbi:energy transducer TonB [Accumulibacter sp.]|uniref:energy transducer TonB n=1 Tax=Accumulibacter sp. TaxID=2053492 RepID=UPI002602B1AE|nr:energy transducer TonB [Accumulibacter sp.]